MFSLVSSSFAAVEFYHFLYIYSLCREQIIYFLLATTSSYLDYHDPQFFASMFNNPVLSVFCHKSCFSRPLIFFFLSSSIVCLRQSRPSNAVEVFPVISRKQPILPTSTSHIPMGYLFLSKQHDSVSSFKCMSQYKFQSFLKNDCLLSCFFSV